MTATPCPNPSEGMAVMATPFDPAAWTAEYEAIGGHVSVVRWSGERAGLWLGLTFPRDPEGRGNAMLEALNNPCGAKVRNRVLIDWVAATRGVLEVSNTEETES